MSVIMLPVLLSGSVTARRIPRALLLTAALVVVVDQLTKAWVFAKSRLPETRGDPRRPADRPH